MKRNLAYYNNEAIKPCRQYKNLSTISSKAFDYRVKVSLVRNITAMKFYFYINKI